MCIWNIYINIFVWKCVHILSYNVDLALIKSLHEHFNYNLKCVSKNIIKCKKILGALCSHYSINIVFLLLFPFMLKNCPDSWHCLCIILSFDFIHLWRKTHCLVHHNSPFFALFVFSKGGQLLQCASGSEDNLGSWFSSSTTRLPVTEFRSSDLEASAFPRWAISPVPVLLLLIVRITMLAITKRIKMYKAITLDRSPL